MIVSMQTKIVIGRLPQLHLRKDVYWWFHQKGLKVKLFLALCCLNIISKERRMYCCPMLYEATAKKSSDDNHVQVETPNINDTNNTNPVDMDTPKNDTAKIVRVKAIVNSEIVMQRDATINIKDHNADIASVALIEHEKEDTKAKSPNKKKPLNKKWN